jgi:hypothetical protein
MMVPHELKRMAPGWQNYPEMYHRITGRGHISDGYSRKKCLMVSKGFVRDSGMGGGNLGDPAERIPSFPLSVKIT